MCESLIAIVVTAKIRVTQWTRDQVQLSDSIYLEVYFLRGMRDDASYQRLKVDSWIPVV